MDIHSLTQKALEIQKLYILHEKKNHYREWTAREIYQGLVSDVGDLGRLVLSKEGFRESPDLEEKLRHELAEILWATLLLSSQYDVDLEDAFRLEMDTLEKRLTE